MHKIFKHTLVKGEPSIEVVAKPKSDSGYTVSPPKVSAPVVEDEQVEEVVPVKPTRTAKAAPKPVVEDDDDEDEDSMGWLND